MNELLNAIKYIPHTFKNALIEIYYNKKLYSIWLVINLLLIGSAFLYINISESLPIEKLSKVWSLSGYLVFFWIACSVYFSMKMLQARGFMLNITNTPTYVLTTVQIINFFILFILSLLMLVMIAKANQVEIDFSLLSVLYFSLMTFLLLLPICTVLALLSHLMVNSRIIIMLLFVLIFISVPILWIPSDLPSLALNILNLNPFYFVVNGIQESVVLGTNSFLNIPTQMIFLFELFLFYIWFNYFYKILKDEINVNKVESEERHHKKSKFTLSQIRDMLFHQE
ncbi:hypothetical protein [Macrococcoides caseolyticum]|uniref:hypothetical protein n=1 Tax=Macrococcoides caseolyticum TaxID=69966 RepID=UPI001F4854D1|nr:hypothetical protein [Macrococcus caseolyticus]MCE4957521.1 hypothetical protein [Macrococcus caseolyticus]